MVRCATDAQRHPPRAAGGQRVQASAPRGLGRRPRPELGRGTGLRAPRHRRALPGAEPDGGTGGRGRPGQAGDGRARHRTGSRVTSNMTTQASQRRRSQGKSSAGTPPGSRPPGGEATAEAAPRGRPRSERAHKAILDAAAELLLARGLSAVSMDAVAERAGVSKATIYRWWPTKETLALDALYTEWDTARSHPRDTGSLRSDLLALLRPWASLASSRPYGRVIAALLTEAQTDPDFAAEYRRRVLE